jgi:hypothetical protein
VAVTRVETFTYNGEVVGGASKSHNTEILDVFGFEINQDVCEFVCRFAVTSSYGSLGTVCQAIEAALRQRYAALTVSFASDTQETFNPALATSTGWDGEPSLRKIEDWPGTSGAARAYEFRVQVALPPNFTDAFGAANGRRQVDANLHYDATEKRVVTFTGVFTQIPNVAARANLVTNFTAYAAYRLNLIAPGNTFALTRREESDPQSLTTLTFTREYSEHLNGQRGMTHQVRVLPSRLREITFVGTYLRTGSASSVNYDADIFSSSATSIPTALAALSTQEGGPLVYEQDCELVSQTPTPNIQDDRTDFVVVIRELNVSQSGGTYLDDPDVVLDQITLWAGYTGTDDSPTPSLQPSLTAIDVAGPTAGLLANVPQGGAAASAPSALAAFAAGLAPSPQGGAGAGPATNGGGANPTGGASVAGGNVSSPVALVIEYQATINAATVAALELNQKWENDLLPYLLELLAEELGMPPLELVSHRPVFDLQNSRIAAVVECRGYPGDLIGFKLSESVAIDWGVRLSPAFSGEPYAYVVQQGLPRQTKTRTIRAIYRTGGAFLGLGPLGSVTRIPGWVLLTTTKPDKVVSVVGVGPGGAGNPVGQVSLTSEVLVETLEYVAKQVNAAVTPGVGSTT